MFILSCQSTRLVRSFSVLYHHNNIVFANFPVLIFTHHENYCAEFLQRKREAAMNRDRAAGLIVSEAPMSADKKVPAPAPAPAPVPVHAKAEIKSGIFSVTIISF